MLLKPRPTFSRGRGLAGAWIYTEAWTHSITGDLESNPAPSVPKAGVIPLSWEDKILFWILTRIASKFIFMNGPWLMLYTATPEGVQCTLYRVKFGILMPMLKFIYGGPSSEGGSPIYARTHSGCFANFWGSNCKNGHEWECAKMGKMVWKTFQIAYQYHIILIRCWLIIKSKYN